MYDKKKWRKFYKGKVGVQIYGIYMVDVGLRVMDLKFLGVQRVILCIMDMMEISIGLFIMNILI